MKQSPLLWTLPEFLYTFIHAHLIPPATEYFLFSTINIILWRCNYFHFCTAYAFAKLMLCSVHFGFIFLYSKVLTISKVRYKKISCCFGIVVLVVLLWATLEAYCSDRNTEWYSCIWGIWIRLHIQAQKKTFSMNQAGDMTAAPENSKKKWGIFT